MIIFFVLLWFGALGGMEIDHPKIQSSNVILPVPSHKELSMIPSLLDIAVRAVCNHIVNKKITIEKAREELPDNIFQPIEHEVVHTVCYQIIDKKISIKDIRENLPFGIPIQRYLTVLGHKDIRDFDLHTITPNHRYILGTGKQRLFRLDLEQNKTIVVDDLKENMLAIALSPSGNRVALLSLIQLKVKDIAQNKVIAEKNKKYLVSEYEYINIDFIGEKGLVVKKRDAFPECMSIEKNLSSHSISGTLLGILHTSLEYVVKLYHGLILRKKIEEDDNRHVTNELGLIPRISQVKPAIYEPSLIMAYEDGEPEKTIHIRTLDERQAREMQSFKESKAVLPLAKYRWEGKEVTALAFAREGQWLMVAGDSKKGSKLIIWDWKNNKQIYTFKLKESVYDIFSTDNFDTSYPCLVECTDPLFSCPSPNYVICSFDPVEMVAGEIIAAARLSQTAVQQTIANSNDPNDNNSNNNNNNNNVSNDNGPKPKTSKKTSSEQDSEETRHKRPKK